MVGRNWALGVPPRSRKPFGPLLLFPRRPTPSINSATDLRKLKGHGLLERVGKSYSYRPTEKGIRVAAMFILFHKRVCGPLANSLFQHRPRPRSQPPAKIEAAYYKADEAIQNLVDLVAA
jgi:hypothetical protein